MLRSAVVVAILATGCGRVGFGLFGDDAADDARGNDAVSTDSSPDATSFDVLIGDSHLVGYWKLDDGFFVDSSAFANNSSGCYASCPTLAAGVRGMAGDFHNSEGIEIGTVQPLASLANNLTLAAWVNLRSITDYGAVLSNDRDCSNCQTLNGFSLWSSLYSLSPTFLLWNQSMTSFGPNGPSGNLPLNTWVFLAATYDGQVARLYIDGTLVNSANRAAAVGVPHSYPLRIGHQGFDFNGGVDGLIDEVMIFDRPLTAPEIQTIYQALES
jgi:hypothetical protein